MNINQLDLKVIFMKQAVLDIILQPQNKSWLRLTTFIKNFYTNVDVAKVDNGAGDHLYCIFSADGVIIKGFDHESDLSPYANEENNIAKGIYDQVPNKLLNLLDDDTMEKDDVTFCIWQNSDETEWKQGNIILPKNCNKNEDGGKSFLLDYIFENEENWFEWATSYYGIDKNTFSYVESIYKGEPITEKIVQGINSERDYNEVKQEISEFYMKL
ncbi:MULTISPECIES: hypothetical protein [Clostridium]|uniref:hypothetical protein n=1 Tax=Clostridium TaxID=1485 RepID=UPI0013EE5665|nr:MULTISPECIES: hypothetical protein [Clostridium]MBY6915768.1 hypothetical protein [Clostridium botulinum]MBZ9692308.1 hypothetical protein [Clostridium sp. M14]NFI53309.1 hypothetical protein [Clostridium botulinum]NFO39222.1 hypothetical protein [Clostridium botulinum]NFQ40158.1 hypothetical protein [Clostridium botulinum]